LSWVMGTIYLHQKLLNLYYNVQILHHLTWNSKTVLASLCFIISCSSITLRQHHILSCYSLYLICYLGW
jgi:hypothetical protein